ncbi:hypothetical protein HMY34_02830 [Thiothrix subterranea]|uniref:hypothetical protein n=1 Tax=Thiothrix subterranea TaxID=2735563 RepID=UPI00192C4B18|nr:hypothetical protein [Thiothrix subterranea]QQZ27771.1 hypothetical protein HMY34_02830 [Thiothrix subterranea]
MERTISMALLTVFLAAGCVAAKNDNTYQSMAGGRESTSPHPTITFTDEEYNRDVTKWVELGHGFRIEARTRPKTLPDSQLQGTLEPAGSLGSPAKEPLLYYHYKDRELDASPLSISPSGKYALLTKDYPTKLILFNTVTGQMKVVGTMDVGYGKTAWNEVGEVATINSRYGQPPMVVYLN